MIPEIPESLIAELAQNRRSLCFPPEARKLAQAIAQTAMGLLFPHFSDQQECDPIQIATESKQLLTDIERFIKLTGTNAHPSAQFEPMTILKSLPELHQQLLLDAKATLLGDPAAQSIDEVILTYPGFYAIAIYRIAHLFHLEKVALLPRMLTEWAHQQTGIDIHPGAEIGSKFCIDHGTGIVIGETCLIGSNVKIYQGVTLGALSVQKSHAGAKRHPTIKDHVVIYANATILGGKTIIGARSVIGGNAWITHSIPPDSVVSQSPDFVKPHQSRDSRLDKQ